MNARTSRGGFTKAQIDLAQSVFGKQWLKGMTGNNVTDDFWSKFKKSKTKRQSIIDSKQKTKIINPVSKSDGGWEWKPTVSDMPKPKFNNQAKKKGKRKEISRKDNDTFYASREWLELRVRVLEKYECKCMMCGRSPKLHGIVIHVDHIKPRSKRPDLSLDFNNLQILCADCNKGKGNKFETDYRPDDRSELSILIAAQERI